ncbi:phosphate signaling complex PhoU family protein [Halopiger goleimassiliensis]|uniref:phosphate signaling complex PhoU family protein n=1 Tax=Halopiger goleimassiliensis TaxID=1293048 RepID=UPI0006781BAF|nr:phosphate uptake regulator PhoU [Halopiger goleimassiliensis]
MSRNPLSNGSHDPVERTVQLAGNSTYVVSLPKEWAVDQNLESGASMYLYPQDDRLVAATDTVPTRERTVRVDVASLGEETALRQVRAAYRIGCDRIVVTGLESAPPELRRQIERRVGRFVGVTIQEDTGDRLTIADVLDAREVSLPQTVAQTRQLVLEMHADATAAVVEDDAELAAGVRARASDVDRLFAFVSRGFHRGLEDVHELDRLGTNRREAFRDYRVSRCLDRIGDHAEGIAEAATRQSGPPTGDLGERIESLARDARDAVEAALEGEIERAAERGATVERRTDELDREWTDGSDPVARYGPVLSRIRRTATVAQTVLETTAEATLLEDDRVETRS